MCDARHKYGHIRRQERVDIHCGRMSVYYPSRMWINRRRRTLSNEEIEEKDVERLGRGQIL